jgi:hypothetical protein
MISNRKRSQKQKNDLKTRERSQKQRKISKTMNGACVVKNRERSRKQ